MRVAVLGASGFLGRHVVPALVHGGHQVVAVARNAGRPTDNVTWLPCDVLEPSLEHALRGVDAVVNLVGIHHGHGKQSFEAMHVELARRLIQAMQHQGVERLLHLSVLCARPDPVLAYHDSKHRGDALIMASDRAWTVLRPAIVYGADDGFTTRLRQQIDLRVAPIPGKGDANHAPVHADDVAQAVERSLASPKSVRKVVPLCGLRTLTYTALVRELVERSGHGCWTPHIPLPLLRFVARSTAWMANPPISLGQLTMIQEGMAQNTRESWELLGLEPRGFHAGHLA
ncbi:MAG: NAD(P)H-binding protein [Deltaproteobacteria bacterium]|nr:NAD(P)H-binding protein [Deltaproteobacteria bacterium]